MITDIAYLEMRVKDFDECLHVYTRELGMTEIQNTQSIQNEKGEWVSTASATQANREAIIQVGNSYLVLREDDNAITQVLPNGDIRSANEVQATVAHFHFMPRETITLFHIWKHFIVLIDTVVLKKVRVYSQ